MNGVNFTQLAISATSRTPEQHDLPIPPNFTAHTDDF